MFGLDIVRINEKQLYINTAFHMAYTFLTVILKLCYLYASNEQIKKKIKFTRIQVSHFSEKGRKARMKPMVLAGLK